MIALYVSVMAYLPNRMYFPQLLTIDQSTLVQTLPKILVYALLELLSLFLLDWMLRRQLQFSPLSQLAFVLETKWKFVQSELVLWVVYIVQSSLQHHGRFLFDAVEFSLVKDLTCFCLGY